MKFHPLFEENFPQILPSATEIGKISGIQSKRAYYNFMVNTAVALGAVKDKIYEEVKDIFNFEDNLSSVSEIHKHNK